MAPREAAAVVQGILARAIEAHEEMRRRDLAPVVEAARAMAQALAGGHKLLVFGNGGSAADAQHFAAELVGRFERERRGAAVIALTADTSVLTSVGNDYGFDRVFARQVEALGREGDVAFAITTSGRSPNLLAGLETARTLGLGTVALTGGEGGEAGRRHDPRERPAGVGRRRAGGPPDDPARDVRAGRKRTLKLVNWVGELGNW